MDTLLIAPHIAWKSNVSEKKLGRKTVTDVVLILKGEISAGLVNQDVISKLGLNLKERL
jgi:hypothetical protein